jgi:hypothetical protein
MRSTGGTISIMAIRPIRPRTASPWESRSQRALIWFQTPDSSRPRENRLIHVRRIAILSQKMGERHRTIEIDHRSDRSSCKSAKISLSFITGFRAGISLTADSGGLTHPWRTASSKSASEPNGLRPGAGGPSSATTRFRSVTSTVSPAAASRMYSLSLFLRCSMPTDLMS